ncbi:MAG TPA: hypothetical protein VIW03_07310 [Anaeromyxobacter sp.]
MSSLISLFLFLHVLSISIWIAGALWVAGDVRRTLGLGKPHAEALASRIRPALGLDALGAIGTFASGILIMWSQAWAPPRPGVAVGILFAAARWGALGAMRRAVRNVLARVRAGEPVPGADPAVKRAAALSGLAHALWLLALAGMVFPY